MLGNRTVGPCRNWRRFQLLNHPEGPALGLLLRMAMWHAHENSPHRPLFGLLPTGGGVSVSLQSLFSLERNSTGTAHLHSVCTSAGVPLSWTRGRSWGPQRYLQQIQSARVCLDRCATRDAAIVRILVHNKVAFLFSEASAVEKILASVAYRRSKSQSEGVEGKEITSQQQTFSSGKKWLPGCSGCPSS